MTDDVNQRPIAVINSVRDGRFESAIRTDARGTELQGTLCKVQINGGENDQTALCRIGQVDLTNPLHTNPAYLPLIMDRGRIPMFSGDADIETTTLELVACIDRKTGKIAARRSNPPSGTAVFHVLPEDISLFQNEKGRYMSVGHLPNRPSIPMTIVNRHYGDMTDKNDRDLGGYGEARHRCVCGQNGSGKTVYTLMMVAGRLVAFPQMGLFCPDTAGDISRDERHSRGDFKFSFLELLRRGGRNFEVVSINDVRLEDTGAFKRCLTPVLLKAFSMTSDKAEDLAGKVVGTLFDEDKIDVSKLAFENVLKAIAERIGECYSTPRVMAEKVEKANGFLDDKKLSRDFERKYEEKVLRFFTGTRTVSGLINSFLNDGAIIILQLHQIPEEHKPFVMYEIFKTIKRTTERKFKGQEGGTVNAEILLDEAPRWIPQSDKSDETAAIIKDGFNTTRKYGLSWTIVSQRIADIDKGVYSQCHTKWFGRNLGVGVDRKHMEDALGPIGISTYDSLQYQGGYFWLGVGSEVNLGTGNAHMSVMTFGGNATEAIIQANPHIWR
jgi:hypothetical protein